MLEQATCNLCYERITEKRWNLLADKFPNGIAPDCFTLPSVGLQLRDEQIFQRLRKEFGSSHFVCNECYRSLKCNLLSVPNLLPLYSFVTRVYYCNNQILDSIHYSVLILRIRRFGDGLPNRRQRQAAFLRPIRIGAT